MLGIGFLATVLASLQIKQDIEQDAVMQFAFTCDQVTLKIHDRLDASALILRGGSAFFAASVSVERKEWQAYVEKLQTEQNVPGTQGFGFAQVIPADQLATHIARIRREGFPDYTVRPPGQRTFYTSIVYLEPFRERNLLAFGYDMYTEPVRRTAMEQARDTGGAVLSGKVELVQETGADVQSGILMYVPVYRNGAAVGTVGQRRAALVGWVYSPFRMNDLMSGILADWERHEGKTVDLAIYEDHEATPASLLFDSQPVNALDVHSLFYRQRTIDFNGQQWLLVFDHTGQSSIINYTQAWAVFIGGLVLSGLLFGLMRSLINTQASAVRIAERLTADIREGQEKLQILLNSTAEGIYGIDLKGDCTFCNNACLRLLGYQQPEALLGKNMHWQIHGKYPDGTFFPVEECRIFKAFKTGEFVHVDDEVLWRSDGSSFVAEYWSYPQLQDAKVVGAVVTFLDITQRKKEHEALIKAEAMLKAGALQKAIFNSANFSSIATDAKGVIQIFNVGAENMLGYTADEVMNKITPVDISDPEEIIARAKALTAELGTPITPGFEALVFKASRSIEDIYELTYVRKDGSRFPAVVSVTALRDAQDVIIGYLLIGTDNTARKQLEADQVLAQRLRDLQFYTRSLIESSIDALMITDISGIITDVNQQMEMLTGYTRDELIGSSVRNYFTDPERVEAGVKLVLSQQKINNYELIVRARDGKETTVSCNAGTLYDQDGRLLGLFAAARDVTEAKHMWQLLQDKNAELESAKLVAEKANLAKSEFLSSMSHELRSPLNAILGFTQLLETDSPPPTPIQQESIAQILEAGWHLLKLINEILDLAKIESGQVPLSLTQLSLTDVILECVDMMEPQAHQQGIKMTLSRMDTPYFVYADKTRVKQVLINLLSNAIKYNSKQGTVELKCTARPEGRVRVSVRDTGAGLDAAQVAQLFEPFNRLGQEAGDKEGTGIGLVVAKQLVELMGGVIGVDSTIGEGSVFWFELTAMAETQLAPQGAKAEALPLVVGDERGHQYTLLYIEDNPANRKLFRQIIARYPNIRLLTATNGISGFEIARESRPDVILLDINLPGINGYEILNILRSEPSTAHITVVALSANAMPSDIEKGLKAGFFSYITKPIQINEFMSKLDRALEFSKRDQL